MHFIKSAVIAFAMLFATASAQGVGILRFADTNPGCSGTPATGSISVQDGCITYDPIGSAIIQNSENDGNGCLLRAYIQAGCVSETSPHGPIGSGDSGCIFFGPPAFTTVRSLRLTC